MPRPKKPLAYLHHKPTNQAYVRIPARNGKRTVVYLGIYGSPESKAEHARILAGYAAAPSHGAAVLLAQGAPVDVTVNEILLAFLQYAHGHYRRADGTLTDEVSQYKQTFRIVKDLYGHTPAREFGPRALKIVRQAMVEAGWCRKLVNQRVGRVKRVFKWAASEELIPATIYQALTTVTGLQAGRTEAEERDPVKPVDDTTVCTTLPFLNRHVAGLVQFQRLTGCRPGEACAVRRCDFDTSGSVWLYRPVQFKTRHRGKARVIAVGPKAQQLLARFFTDNPTDYLFSPQRAVEELHAARAANRKTPIYPSHARRNAKKRIANPKRKAKERYAVTAYEHAIADACEKAFPVPSALTPRSKESRKAWWARLTDADREAVKDWRRKHRWAPNQLRHTHGTDVRHRFGLEAAQVALGHERADVTQVYAEKNLALAVRVASEIG